MYNKTVRNEIKKLRNANVEAFDSYNNQLTNKRVKWFKENHKSFDFIDDNILSSGYKLLLNKFNITKTEAPIIKETESSIVFHSKNFCPTLEACKILGLDTRIVCKRLNEKATDALIKQVDSQLTFSRNYEKIRPYTDYCEEIITIKQKKDVQNKHQIGILLPSKPNFEKPNSSFTSFN